MQQAEGEVEVEMVVTVLVLANIIRLNLKLYMVDEDSCVMGPEWVQEDKPFLLRQI
jgi:hypothetical protein